MSDQSMHRGNKLTRALSTLLIAGMLVLAGFGAAALLGNDNPFGELTDASRYQAVFLTNDRVYFGHLRWKGADIYELRDVFFLRETTGSKGDVQRQVASLSEELHGPENRMLIPRERIVLVENLRKDSPVARAIDASL